MWHRTRQQEEEEEFSWDDVSDHCASPVSCQSDGWTQSDMEELEIALYSRIHHSANVESAHIGFHEIEAEILERRIMDEQRSENINTCSPETIVLSSDESVLECSKRDEVGISGRENEIQPVKDCLWNHGDVIDTSVPARYFSLTEELNSYQVPVITLDASESEKSSNSLQIRAGEALPVTELSTPTRGASLKKDRVKKKPEKNKRKFAEKLIGNDDSNHVVLEQCDMLPVDISTNVVMAGGSAGKRTCYKRLLTLSGLETTLGSVGEANQSTGQLSELEKSWTDEISHVYSDAFDADLDRIRSLMPDNPDLWIIDQEDQIADSSKVWFQRYFMPKKRIRCHNCQEWGHHMRKCPEKYKIPCCYMCGEAGHKEPACQKKFCLQCGRPFFKFSHSCTSCKNMGYLCCSLCKATGHRIQNCPDLWRRFHITTKEGKPEVPSKNIQRPQSASYCANCASKGHLYFECQVPYSSSYFPVLPHVVSYGCPFENTAQIVNDKPTACLELFLSTSRCKLLQQFDSGILQSVQKQTGAEVRLVRKGENSGLDKFQFFGSVTGRTQAKAMIVQHLQVLKRKCKKERKKMLGKTNVDESAVGLGKEHDKMSNLAASPSEKSPMKSAVKKCKNKEQKSFNSGPKISDRGKSQTSLGNLLESGEKSNNINQGISMPSFGYKVHCFTSWEPLSLVRAKLIETVESSLRKLMTELPNVRECYNTICSMHKQYKNLSDANPLDKSNWSLALAELNFAVRGQAGLGNGHHHRQMLVKLIAKLKKRSWRIIPQNLFLKIRKHYDFLFKGCDYKDTLKLAEQYLKMKENKTISVELQQWMKQTLDGVAAGDSSTLSQSPSSVNVRHKSPGSVNVGQKSPCSVIKKKQC